ncbi:ATP-binding protein [Thiomonas sp. 13-64-67]|jgi:signal transduction histidine kinase|uniref:ATP-binding protein n=1 Tax=Thiomonas sp. 13-64-67 TaxID=1970447 RepID=UPI00257DF442|nr:ATP-binding protein [Thiomonas sp. 13-64-67]
MRLLPASLFGRMMLILFSGLVLAQILSASINFAERDRLLLRSSGMQSAQRIADIVKLLDSLGPAEQQRIVTILSVPPQVVKLEAAPRAPRAAALDNPHAAMFSAALHAALGDARPLRVSVRQAASGARPSGLESGRQDMMGGHGGMAAAMSGMPDMQAMKPFMPSGLMFLTQVQLRDGSWVAFDTQLPQGPASTPWRLLLTLLVLLLTVLVLSYAAVRWMTRPLAVLASAADALGKDINRPPLPETGPTEVRRAAHAFNIMQSSLVRFIQDRTRIFAAMSHDLKTPITRMRLRTELLEDADLRQRFDKDLREMELMVTHTLDFMRGLETPQVVRPIDITALLESLQADNQDMQREVLIEGRALTPYVGDPERLKRCVSNLIDNAILYGRQACIIVEDSPAALTLRIRDQGPGIAPDELDKVFEPFYRLEASRSRETGGTGLGLGIARNIARAAGGDVTLRNHPDGGLEATLHLPRKSGYLDAH